MNDDYLNSAKIPIHLIRRGASKAFIVVFSFCLLTGLCLTFAVGRCFYVYYEIYKARTLPHESGNIPEILKNIPRLSNSMEVEVRYLFDSSIHGKELCKQVDKLKLNVDKIVLSYSKISNSFSNKEFVNPKIPAEIDIIAGQPNYFAITRINQAALLVGRSLITKGEIQKGISILEGAAYVGAAIARENSDRHVFTSQATCRALLRDACMAFISSTTDFQPSHELASLIIKKLKQADRLQFSLSFSMRIELRVFEALANAWRLRGHELKEKGVPDLSATYGAIEILAKPYQKMLFESSIPHLDKVWWKGYSKLRGSDLIRRKYLDESFGPIIFFSDKLPTPSGWKVWFHRLTNPYLALTGEHLIVFTPMLEPIYKVFNQDKQTVEAACTVLALSAYRKENNRLPESLVVLNNWWKKKEGSKYNQLGKDIFTGKPMIYSFIKRHLASAGPDEKAGTRDDIIFLPVKSP